MSPFVNDPDFVLHVGDALEVLGTLPDESVHCVVTSPPYWGLRDYGTGSWEGGDDGCDHRSPTMREGRNEDRAKLRGSDSTNQAQLLLAHRSACGKCGAVKVDHQLGLEPTPEEYVSSMVAVFREVRRVLRRDGTCWLNIGDSYASGPRGNAPDDWSSSGLTGVQTSARYRDTLANGTAQTRDKTKIPHLKPKDLVGIPWRLAFALQQPYYTGRIERERDRVWLAAMIDAEGTICGFRHERPDGNIRTGCLTFITNGSEAILDECDRIWPGSRYTETLKAGDKVLGGVATRPCWRWELQRAEDRSALVSELYPYLIEKKRQALVAWNLLELVQAAKRMGRGGETSAIKDKRDHLVRTLSDLNQKRDVDLPSWLEPVPSLHEEGWYVRSDIVWSKKNPMPESVTDRPTKAHEYLFLLTKSARYFYDADSIREAHLPQSLERWKPGLPRVESDERSGKNEELNRQMREKGISGNGTMITAKSGALLNPAGRNKRSVWEIATEPYPDAHFATFPQSLVEPCVLAGTSERGCCPVCGAPKVPQVVRTPLGSGPSVDPTALTGRKGMNRERRPDEGTREITKAEQRAYATQLRDSPHRAAMEREAGTAFAHYVRTDDSGARPLPPALLSAWLERGWLAAAEASDCGCDAGSVPCTVLDPFMGSGTVAVVARRLGRRAIGIELNPEYATLASKRLAQLSLLAA